MRKLNVYDTAHAPNQFTSVAKLPAIPLIFIGNICDQIQICIGHEYVYKFVTRVYLFTSDITTQGTAPIPAEKDPTYI